MFGASAIVCSALLSLLCDQVASLQIPLHGIADQTPTLSAESERRPRQLHGRFLQVTDFHPDSFYETYSSTSEDAACHRGTGPAGYYGAETSECDSPKTLVNATFDWIKAELKDSIDFVIWTGDSARHDNDEENPRTIDQVVGLNEYMVQKFVDTFGKPDNEDDDDPTNDLVVPIVPTFGNNDILPHNIFDLGPNQWTKRYLGIWKRFIPEAQRHQFDQGGWFSVEVIPNHLAVFSLNSLYFFDSNSAVDGCAAKSEPGYRQLEWMRIQLQFLRDRNMKAIIIGHVPPARTDSKRAWDETCWQKYALWMHQYRDVVTGSMYGHMNTDHFMLQDSEEIDKDVSRGYEMVKSKKRSVIPSEEDQPVDAQVSTNYLVGLRDLWSKLPQPPSKKELKKLEASQYAEDDNDDFNAERSGKGKKKKGDKDKKKHPHDPRDYLDEIGGFFAERFSVSLAAPSVVPNYFPTIRVYEYNITGLNTRALQPHGWSEELHSVVTSNEDQDELEGSEYSTLEDEVETSRKKEKKNKNKEKKRRFTVPHPPSSAAPPGPAYSPQSLSMLRFTQYFANLTKINNDFDVEHKNQGAEQLGGGEFEQQKWKEGKHHGQKPHDKGHEPHPKKFKYEVLYDTRDDEVYNMTDLTTRSYIDLAQRIGNSKGSKKSSSLFVNEEESEGDIDESENLDVLKKKDNKGKKHGKKGKKKHGKNKKRNEAWYAFVKRAFVATMDDDEIESVFG